MLYHLFTYLDKHYDVFGAGLFSYISFRAALAILMSLGICLIYGTKIIAKIQALQIIEKERILGLPGEELKKKTPTMGGILIIISILIPTLLLADLTNIYVIMLITSTLWMGAIGFLDDYLKLTRGKDGLAAKWKLIGQVGLGLFVGVVMYLHKDVVVRVDEQTYKSYIAQASHTSRVVSHQCNRDTITTYYIKSTMTNAPFYKDGTLDYAGLLPMAWDKAKFWAWLIFIPFVILIVTSVSNAANLTDGIDGLAASVSAIVASTLVVLAYVSGHSFFADYLNILYIPWSGEIVVFTSAFIGACIGFLWYNTYPAQIFMGDTGSLTLGGIIAAIAIMIRKELLIPVLCGVFLAENLSVVLQVTYFKYTKRKFGEGRRIFLMSPLHHHFQKMGMHEAKIVSRFIIVSIMLAVITMITLKIR